MTVVCEGSNPNDSFMRLMNGKGGENGMVCEWDRLMELPKEELVMELVKARRSMRNLQAVLSELADNGGSAFLYDPGSKPSDEWLERIAEHAASKLDADDHLTETDLCVYGVDFDTADEYFDEEDSE